MQGRGSEGRQSPDSLFKKQEVTSGLSAEHWGAQGVGGGRREGSALEPTLRWEVGLSHESHKQLSSCHRPGPRDGLMFFFSSIPEFPAL